MVGHGLARNHGSVPAARRPGLSRWRRRTISVIPPVAATIGHGLPSAQITAGAGREAPIEANETIRETPKISTKAVATHKAAPGQSPSRTPNPVATPLPPRKRRNTGKTFPATAANAAAPDTHGAAPSDRARTTGSSPLARSPASVRTPRRLPAVRATLVAPMFPFPSARTSTPEVLTSSRPVGIEPSRYPNTRLRSGWSQPAQRL